MYGEAQVGQKDPVFVPYFSIQFSTQWEASLERLACTECPSLRGLNGTPEWIRTTDLLLRRQTLYPSELRAHMGSTSIVGTFPPDGQTGLWRP